MAQPVLKAASIAAQSRTVRTVVLGVIGVILVTLITPFLVIAFTIVSAVPADDADIGEGAVVVGGWAHPLGGKHPWSTRLDHSGGAVDIPIPIGSPVYAVAAGTVWDLSEKCGGLLIGVQHSPGLTTVSAHLSRAVVKQGQQVAAGQLIGYSGTSGSCSQGPHLHFEVRIGSSPTVWGLFVPADRFMWRHGIDLGPCISGCSLFPR